MSYARFPCFLPACGSYVGAVLGVFRKHHRHQASCDIKRAAAQSGVSGKYKMRTTTQKSFSVVQRAMRSRNRRFARRSRACVVDGTDRASGVLDTTGPLSDASLAAPGIVSLWLVVWAVSSTRARHGRCVWFRAGSTARARHGITCGRLHTYKIECCMPVVAP